MRPTDKIFLGIGTVAVVASATFVGITLFTKTDAPAETSSPSTNSSSTTTSSTSTSSTSTPPDTSSTPTQSSSSTTTSYKDGTYTAAVSYRVPHGSNSLSTTLTLKNGTIATVKTSSDYTDHESAQYISGFTNRLTAQVAGKLLQDFAASRIGGASLTTEAFLATLDTIKNDAKR